VILTGRSLERLTSIRAHLIKTSSKPEQVVIETADLTIDDDRKRLLARAASEFDGCLDLVVNSAGVGATGHFDTHSPEVLRQLMELNFFALAELTRLLPPLMSNGVHPTLVNLGSIVARRALPGRAEYSASKFAVAGFSEAIRAEWVKYGIHVILLNPGFTATEFEANLLADTARIKVTDRRRATADEVALAALKAIRRKKSEVTLTFEGNLLLLLNRLVPRFVDHGFARFTKKVFHEDVSK
jgi:short-subunit dehydrogenase